MEGPVLIEAFLLWLREGVIELTGPCGAAPWYIEAGGGVHPVQVVERIVASAIGPPDLVHSTSWRQGTEGVILSFFVVISSGLAAGIESAPVNRSDLAPGQPPHRLPSPPVRSSSTLSATSRG